MKWRFTLPETKIALKIDGWKTIPFGKPYFQGQTVSFMEGSWIPYFKECGFPGGFYSGERERERESVRTVHLFVFVMFEPKCVGITTIQ